MVKCHRVQGLMDTVRLLVLCYADGVVSQLLPAGQRSAGQAPLPGGMPGAPLLPIIAAVSCHFPAPMLTDVGPLAANPGALLCRPSLWPAQAIAVGRVGGMLLHTGSCVGASCFGFLSGTKLAGSQTDGVGTFWRAITERRTEGSQLGAGYYGFSHCCLTWLTNLQWLSPIVHSHYGGPLPEPLW
jgi:hypothetical protein